MAKRQSRWMNSLFASHCMACKRVTSKGTRIYYDAEARRATCASCAEPGTKPIMPTKAHKPDGATLAKQYTAELLTEHDFESLEIELRRELERASQELDARRAPFHGRMSNSFPDHDTDTLSTYATSLKRSYDNLYGVMV